MKPTSRQSRSRAASGTVVEGPGFYVWDEDARVALLWGRELAAAVEDRWRGCAGPSETRPDG